MKPTETNPQKRWSRPRKGPDHGLRAWTVHQSYPGFDQQVPVLLLERGLSVKLFLSLEVFDQEVDVALGAGQRGVPSCQWENLLNT